MSVVVAYGIGRTKKYLLIVKETQCGELLEIVIAKKSQHKGIGTKIALALIGFFRKVSIISIEFIVDSKNTESIKVWEKTGFKAEPKAIKKPC